MNLFEEVAAETKMPEWWVESIAIEYTDCREYAVSGKLWKFNFNKLSKKKLKEALNTYKVVCRDSFIDNVHSSNFGPRILMRMASNAVPPIAFDKKDVIPDGPLSVNAFPFQANSIDIADPKIGFSECFQVFDEGKLWQWHFADFTTVPGRSYGKWVSSEIDLEPFDQITTKHIDLNGRIVNPKESGYDDFVTEVEDFYRDLENIKHPILERLYDLHEQKKKLGNFKGELTYSPPLLSHFETFKIADKTIYTNFLAEPIFFRECHDHVKNSERLTASAANDEELIKILDRIYQARVTAIVLGTACLEAFIKNILSENFPKIFDTVSRIGFEEQLEIYYILKINSKPDYDRMPYQFLKDIRKRRNSIIHFKHQWQKAPISGKKSRTYINSFLLDGTFVHSIPVRIEDLIKKICSDTSIDIPGWLNEKDFWMKI